jgi:two-component system LytT family response regulator
MFSAFVVDDEPRARDNLVHALRLHAKWQNIQTYSSGKTLLVEVERLEPDVVFLDVKMPGENGLVLARQLLKLSKPPLLVFVTAFSDYAVTAFELYAMDYLLKPFDDARMSICINKLEHALLNHSAHQKALLTQNAWALTKPLEKIVIKSSNALRVIPTAQIFWLAANGNYVDIHHEEGKHLLRGSLKNILSCLPESEFVQVHRGIAARISLIREIKSLHDEQFSCTLITGDVLSVGKSFHKDLVASLYGD